MRVSRTASCSGCTTAYIYPRSSLKKANKGKPNHHLPPLTLSYVNATINGGIRGAALAAAICTPSYFLLKSRSATYRALPIPLKALGLVVISVPCISISAEKAGEAYERSMWTGVGQRELVRQGEVAEQRWEELSTGEKIKNWANRNQYGIVGGSWAASMAIAFGIVTRNKYASLPQKVRWLLSATIKF